MNAMAETTGAFRINGGTAHPGTLVIIRDLVRLATLGPKVDPRWSARDEAGHFHAYSLGEDRYPTLFETSHPCDSPHLDGEGWWCECWTGWECRICKEVMVPGMVSGPHEEMHPGRQSWEASVLFECQECPIPEMGAMVTLEASFSGSVTRFGIAVVTGTSQESWVAGHMRTTVLVAGAGPLGERRS